MSVSLHDKKEVAEIRKESLDIYNRIRSIAEDALFVEKVAECYGEYPVIRAVHLLSLAGPDSNGDPQQTSDAELGMLIRTWYVASCTARAGL